MIRRPSSRLCDCRTGDQGHSSLQALEIVTRYVPEGLGHPRVQYLLKDLFNDADS
jgi:hypothetical protein